jgi:tetratricopeptide (TPR) repeat protein
MIVHTAYTCIILLNDQSAGSGFLVHEDGLVATCRHVLAAGGEDMDNKRFAVRLLNGGEAVPASIHAMPPKENPEDVALLKIDGPVPEELKKATLVQSDGVRPGHAFELTGHGKLADAGHQYDFLPAHGDVAGIVRRDRIEMLQLSSNEILQGMSGAPITVPELGGVVGLLSARYSADPKSGAWMQGKAWAARIEALAALDPRLKVQKPVSSPALDQGLITGQGSRQITVTDEATATITENNITLTQIFSAGDWKRPHEYDPQRRWETVVGRGEQITMLAARFSPERRTSGRVVVYGLSGIGKSTLAAAYVDRHGDEYEGGVLWASTGLDIQDEILNRWAHQAYQEEKWQTLKLTGQLHFDPTAVRRMLDGHGPLLAVFDDVRSPDDIAKLLTALPAESHILITTRELSVAQHFDSQPIRLEQLDLTDAVELLRYDLDNLSDADLRALANAVGAHPQTMRVAAAHIRGRSTRERRQRDIAALLSRLENGEGFGFSDRDAPAGQFSFDVAFRFIYDEIDDDPACRETYQRWLRQLGILPSSEADFSTELAAVLWDADEDKAAEFLEMLRDRSVVVPTVEGRWSQHVLVRSVMRALLAQYDEEQQAQGKYVLYSTRIAAQLDNVLENWQQLAPDLPHVHVVGNLLADWLEEYVQYDPAALTIDTLVAFDSDVPVDNVAEGLEIIRQFMISAAPYIFNHPHGQQLARRWFTGATVACKLLGDADTEALLMVYWYRLLLERNQPDDALLALNHLHAIADRTSMPLDAHFLALSQTGSYYKLNGQTEEALALLREAHDLMSAHPEVSDGLKVNLLMNYSSLYFSISQPEQALEYCKQAYGMLPKGVGYLRLQVTQLLSLCYSRLGKHEEALQFFADAEGYLDISDALGIKADVLNNKAYIYISMGELDSALAAATEALNLARETNDLETQVISLNHLAQIKLSLNQLEEGCAYLEQAREKLPYFTNKALDARTIGNLGVAYYALGRSEEALIHLRQSLSALSEIQDRTFAIQILGVIGTVFRLLGQIEEGIEFFKQMLDVINQLNSDDTEITILNWISLLYQHDGNSQQALRYFERVIPSLERITEPSQRGPALMLIAETHGSLGRLNEALRALQEALQIWRRLSNRNSEAQTLLSMANCYLLLRDFESVQRALDECLPLIENSNNLPAQQIFYKTRGLLLLDRQEIQQAIEDFERSLELCEKTDNHQAKIANINNIALAHLRAKDYQSARVQFQEALEQVRDSNWPHLQALILSNLSLLFFIDGQPDRGCDMMRTAIDVMEQNDLTIDAGGQTIELLRIYLEIFSHMDALDQRLDFTPRQALTVLVHSNSWAMAEALVNMDILHNPVLDRLFQHEITRVADQLTMVEILRMYRQILTWVREGNIPQAFVRARDEFEKPFLYHWWGRVNLASKGYAAALVNLNRAVELDEQQSLYYVDRGWAYRGLGDYSAALADFERGLIRKPKSDAALLGRGVIHFEQRNLGSALADLEQAIELNPRSALAHQWRAGVLLALGDTNAALHDLDQAIRLVPQDPDHYYWRALTRLRSGDYSGALEDLKQVYRQDVPDSYKMVVTLLWRGLGQLLAGRRDYAQADWQLAERNARRLINRIEQHMALALHASLTGRFEQAYRHYGDTMQLRYVRHTMLAQHRHLNLLEQLLPQQPQLLELSQWLGQELIIKSI